MVELGTLLGKNASDIVLGGILYRFLFQALNLHDH
jgi:hypothetical protein